MMIAKKTGLSVEPFRKALRQLKIALESDKNDLVRDAAIQRFEFTFELAWKAIKRYLELNSNIREFNVKNLFREAGKQGLLDSVESWFGYLDARNRTSHTYNEETAEQTYQAAKRFCKDAETLLTRLEKLIV